MSALSAALDTLYAGEPPVITEIEPPSLLTFTILGRVLERSIGSSASITRQGPNRLTSIASATVPRSALLAVAHRSYMVDALFTSTSVRPNRFFTHSAIAATLTELSTSSWQAMIRLPSGSSSLAASSPRAQVPGAEHHREAEQGQLPAYFTAHAAVAASHHSHRLVSVHTHHQRQP